jgi:hypothetical protein
LSVVVTVFVACQDTKIKGANLQATNQLNIDTKNLEVSSVQNKHKAKTRSQGASLGIGSSGVNSKFLCWVLDLVLLVSWLERMLRF